LGLAQLQRRIRDEAQRKLRLKAREQEKRYAGVGGSNVRSSLEPLRFNPAETLRGGQKNVPGNSFGEPSELSDAVGDSEKENRGASSSGMAATMAAGQKPAPVRDRGNARRKYQELAEVQQLASVLIEEHLDSQEIRKRNEFDRLYTLGHVAHLAAQLKNPPTLDQAKSLFSASADGAKLQTGGREKPGLRVDTGHGSRPASAHHRASHAPNLSTVPEDKVRYIIGPLSSTFLF
jgi:hypothetical protein